MVLESVSSIPSVTCISGISEEPVVEFNMHDDLIYLIGGYDGESWLSSTDAYSPSRDLIKMLRPMNIPRSYASTAKLNGEIYVFGGGVGETEWYDTGILPLVPYIVKLHNFDICFLLTYGFLSDTKFPFVFSVC